MNNIREELERIVEPFYNHTVTREGSGKKVLEQLETYINKVREEDLSNIIDFLCTNNRVLAEIGLDKKRIIKQYLQSIKEKP